MTDVAAGRSALLVGPDRSDVFEFDDDGGVIGGLVQGARTCIDGAGGEARGEIGRKKEVIDADAAILFEGPQEVVPEGEPAGFSRMEGAKCIDVAHIEHGAETGAGLGLEKGVGHPVRRLVAVDVLGDDVEIAADHSGSGRAAPGGHLQDESVHPVELVEEFVAACGVPIGQIDIDDAQPGDEGFDETGVRVLVVARQSGADGFDGVAREDGDAVVCLLRDSDRFVAERTEGKGGKLGGLELLEQEDVRLLGLEPRGDVSEAGADGVDVPGGDADGGFSREKLYACWVARER